MRMLPMMLVTIAAIGVAACGEGGGGSDASRIPGKELSITRVAGKLPVDDPGVKVWATAPEVVVPLLTQDVAEPRLTTGGVESVRLRGLCDGERVAIRITWDDPTAEDLVDVDRSTDAVALEVPATGEGGPVPDSMMGEEGKPVSIILWRHSWQVRHEGGKWGIDALYPNKTVDHYPPDAGPTPGSRSRKLERIRPRWSVSSTATPRPALSSGSYRRSSPARPTTSSAW
jgi:hypothetical protein